MVRAQVEAVVSRVLRNQIQLFYAVSKQCLGLRHDLTLRTTAMRAAHPGNDTEAARVVAALGDFDVGEVPRREPEARRAEIRNESRSGMNLQEGRVRVRSAECGVRSFRRND